MALNIQITPAKSQQIMEAGRKQLSPEEYGELESLLLDLEIYGFSQWINVRLGTLMSKIEWELEIEPSPEFSEALKACDFAFLGEELKMMCRDAGLSPVGHKKLLCGRLYNANVPEVVAVMEPHLTEEDRERIKWLPQTKDERQWHPDYIAFLRTLKGKSLSDFDIRSELHPAGFKRSYYRAYLGNEMIVGAESRAKVVENLKKLLERVKLVTERLPQTEHLYVEKVRDVKDRLEEIYRTDPDEFYRRKKLFEQAIKERERGKEELMPEFSLEELRSLLKFTNLLYR